MTDPSGKGETEEGEVEGKDQLISAAVGEGGGEMDDESAMMALMGFSGFDSTKDKKVLGEDIGMADIKKKRVYRQYMNRKGGFNRPLDKVD
ncbi:MAG: hypothetical protein DHS80DRAFT_15296 [Piptocephalis tieghemiana]|nr:MAG: hypothetical protein DHS80DRAFT_15296 [Piptocephalis tieghemiana]